MRTAIVGAGAMGSLFSGLMALSGQDVWLVGHRASAHVEAIRAGGLRMTHPDGDRQVKLQVTIDPREVGPVDSVIFLTKAYSTAAAARHAAPLFGPATVAVTVQNGVGNAEAIRDALGPRPILAGVTNIGGNLLAPGTMNLTDAARRGGGGTWIGPFEGSATAAQMSAVAASLRQAGILVHEEADIALTIWRKMALACGMASIGSVGRLRVGTVLDTEEGVKLLHEIIGEIVAVAQAKGIALELKAALDYSFGTYEMSRQHVTSMAADVVAGRPTEIGAFNEAVVREGERLGVPVPVNRTMARLIRVIEGNYPRILPMTAAS